MFPNIESAKARMTELRHEAELGRLAAEARRVRRESARKEAGGQVRKEKTPGESPGGRTGGVRRALRWGTGA